MALSFAPGTLFTLSSKGTETEELLTSDWFYEVLSINVKTQTGEIYSLTGNRAFDGIAIDHLFKHYRIRLFSKEEYQAILVQQFIQEAAGGDHS